MGKIAKYFLWFPVPDGHFPLITVKNHPIFTENKILFLFVCLFKTEKFSFPRCVLPKNSAKNPGLVNQSGIGNPIHAIYTRTDFKILQNTGANSATITTEITALMREVARLVPQTARVTFSGSRLMK